MKVKKYLSIILITIFFSLPFTVFAEAASTTSGMKAVIDFPDVPKIHNSYVAISYLVQNGIFKGYADGSFGPDKEINRAEILKVILNAAKIDSPKDFTESAFPDVAVDAWFAPFVMKARSLGIVKGNGNDGTFAPGRSVNKSEFLKMLLTTYNIKPILIKEGETISADVPSDAWFAPYMNYAYKVGIIDKDSKGNLNPSKLLNRSEVADMIYLLTLLNSSKDTQFLLHRAESELAQVDLYIASNKVNQAKRSSELAVDLTQQAYKNKPTDSVVLGAAKLARAYDWLVDSFVYGVKKDNEKAAEWANKAIDKASEAWEANNATQPIARHIKEGARDVLAQVGGVEE